jgi:hypothetical protein
VAEADGALARQRADREGVRGGDGINAGTLQFWKYKLKKREERLARRRPKDPVAAVAASIVEVRPVSLPSEETRFEIELANGRRLRLPTVCVFRSIRALVPA